MKSIRSRVRAGDILLGCFLNLGSSLTAEIVGDAGFDWVLLDLEHGVGTERELLHQLQALEHTPAAAIVRVESNDRPRFHRTLDLGAHGIMVPRVDTPTQAEQAIASIRFPPMGIRGVATLSRAGGFGTRTSAYFAKAKDDILGIVQIESKESLQHLDAIAAIEGVDVLFIGPSDLTQSLGIPGQIDSPQFLDAVRLTAEATARHGKASGILLRCPEDLPRFRQMGFTFLACGSDGGLITRGAQTLVADLRNAIQPDAPSRSDVFR